MKIRDWSASLVVFLVALPLCLGIALASQAPLISGLVAGVIGGLVIAPLSGSRFSVSGPAAGLAVIVASGIENVGSFETFCFAVAIAGVLQLLFGVLRIGSFAGLIPNSVVKGLLAAIGVLIILKQIPHALGWDRDFEGDFGFWHFDAQGESNTFTDLIKAIASLHPGALIISFSALSLMLLWDKTIKNKTLKLIIPGPLLGVALGIILNELFKTSFPQLALLGEDGHLVQLPQISAFELFQPKWSAFNFSALMQNTALIKTALTIAIVASIETLLSIEASDQLDPEKRISNRDRELLAQGMGNIVSGSLGGLPLTSVIVRSSANISAGAESRLSAILHSFWLLIAILFLDGLIQKIPLSALAAVLLLVGYKLTTIKLFSQMIKKGFTQFMPFLITVVAIVFTDILTGVCFGIIAGVISTLITNTQSSITHVHEENSYLIKFTKDVPFYNKKKLKEILASIPEGAELTIEGSQAMFIDDDIIECVEDFKSTAHNLKIKVELRNLENKRYPGYRKWNERIKLYGFSQKTTPRK